MRKPFCVLLTSLFVGGMVSFLAACNGVDEETARGEVADTVLLDGKIWTADEQNPAAEAVAIKADEIVAVGSTSEIRKYVGSDTQVISLQGKRVVPGFQDSHSHFLAAASLLDPLTGRNPFEPVYSEYNELTARFTRLLLGLSHHFVNWMGWTPLDILIIPPASPEQALSGIRFGMQELLKMGITTMFELGAHWEHYEAVSLLKERGELKLRCELFLTPEHLDELVERGITRHDGDEWLRILGIKLYSDGWLGPRTASLREPYADREFFWQNDPEYSGILYFDQEEINNDVLKAHEAGLKIATHAIGDKASEVVLNAYENALYHLPNPDHRHTLEHAQVLAPDLMKRIKKLGVICSIQLSFATTDMHFAEKALGSERMSHAYAWKTMLDEGIRCAGGSDFAVEVLSPLWGIQRIVTRQDLNGLPENGWYPDQCLSVEEALRLITIDSAYNSFEEDIKGSIEVGKLADLVVLSQDILEIPPNQIADTVVEMTMVGGEIAYVWPDSAL